MCDRLVWLMTNILRMRPAELAKRLGYKNPTTIAKVKKRETFLDSEKLQRLAEIETDDGRRPNLHWLITGYGPPVVGEKGTRLNRSRAIAERLVRNLGPEKIEAIERLFGAPEEMF